MPDRPIYRVVGARFRLVEMILSITLHAGALAGLILLVRAAPHSDDAERGSVDMIVEPAGSADTAQPAAAPPTPHVVAPSEPAHVPVALPPPVANAPVVPSPALPPARPAQPPISNPARVATKPAARSAAVATASAEHANTAVGTTKPGVFPGTHQPVLLAARPIEGLAANRQPIYPRSARLHGEQGLVAVRITVSPAGLPIAVVIEQSSGHDLLDAAAINVTHDWRFVPETRDGVAVTGEVIQRFSFRLE